MKTLHKIIKRAGAVLLHNEVANMKLQQLFEQVVAQNPPFATTLIFNLYEDSARFTVEAVLDDEAVVIGRDMFSGMAFNQTERNAAKATQSLFEYKDISSTNSSGDSQRQWSVLVLITKRKFHLIAVSFMDRTSLDAFKYIVLAHTV